MPDNQNGYSATGEHVAYRITRDILGFLTMVFVAWNAQQSNRNSDDIKKVEQRQEIVIDRQIEAVQNTKKVKDTLDNKTESDDKALGVQLYSTFKYLEDVAAISHAPKDIAKAAEARKLYDDHVIKQASKPTKQ